MSRRYCAIWASLAVAVAPTPYPTNGPPLNRQPEPAASEIFFARPSILWQGRVDFNTWAPGFVLVEGWPLSELVRLDDEVRSCGLRSPPTVVFARPLGPRSLSLPRWRQERCSRQPVEGRP